MRQLTDSEREARTKKYLEYEKSSKEALTLGEKWAFDAGFTAARDHAAEQIAALTAERDSLRAEVTRLREAQFKAAKDLKRMVRDWRAHAAGRYCSIYNPEMGKGLRNAAGNLEEYINNQIQGEQGQ